MKPNSVFFASGFASRLTDSSLLVISREMKPTHSPTAYRSQQRFRLSYYIQGSPGVPRGVAQERTFMKIQDFPSEGVRND